MTTETVAGSREHGLHRVDAHARAHSGHRLADRAAPWFGKAAARLNFIDNALLSRAVERHCRHDRHAALRRTRHQHAGQPCAGWPLGTLIGGAPALVLGIAMGLNRWVRAIFDPLVSGDLSESPRARSCRSHCSLRPRRRFEDFFHGGDRRILPGGDQCHGPACSRSTASISTSGATTRPTAGTRSGRSHSLARCR